MKNNVLIFKEIKHALLYVVLSTIWSIVDFFVFLWLQNLWFFLIPSNIISEFCGMITSFSLNIKKNFKQNDRIKSRFIKYVCVCLFGMLISTWLVYRFINWLWMGKEIAKFVQILIISIPLYVINRFITFKKY